jgi:hypothetical protein
MRKEMAEIESEVEEITDSQYLPVSFTADFVLSSVECRGEFVRHLQGCLNGDGQQRGQSGQLA